VIILKDDNVESFNNLKKQAPNNHFMIVKTNEILGKMEYEKEFELEII
jgi:hypothetical protein